MKTCPLERAFSMAFAIAIPAATGLALLLTLPPGGGNRGHADHQGRGVLVVELIPLENLPAPSNRGAPPTTKAQNSAHLQVTMPVGSSQSGTQPAAGGAQSQAVSTATLAGAQSSDGAVNPDGIDVLSYREQLLAHVARHRRYPAGASRASIQGTVEVRFVLDRAGVVHGAWIVSSSGRMVLDEEALATIRRATPMPRIPSLLPDMIDITLPIDFEIG